MKENKELKHKALAYSPTAEMVKEARYFTGLTQAEAAAKIRATQRAWQGWEQGTTTMHPGLWEYFLLVTGQSSNPKFQVK